MDELVLNAPEYKQLKRGFQGGFVHGRAKYIAEGKTKPLEDAGSVDFISSYPAQMLLEKLPMSASKLIDKIENWNQFYYYLNNYCCLFDVTIYNIRPKVDYDHPISVSKIILPENKEERAKILSGIRVDNGRIVTAEKITITMTEQDWFTFTDFYKYGNDEDKDSIDIQIHLFRIYEKGFLPKPFYMAVLELYKKKTELKGVKGREVDYMIGKNMANASFGMTVTDIVRDIFEYDLERSVYKKRQKPNIEEAIDKYNKSKKRFLFYPWGVWITAYARRKLFRGILAIGDDYIYSDTDSIKMLNYEKHFDYIEKYNNEIKEKIRIAAKHFNISEDEYSPLTSKGIPKTIGTWELDGVYKRFKSLGAKRYLCEYMDGHYELTVAGVNKKKACEYLVEKYGDPFTPFTHGMEIPEDYSGRLTSTYIDEPCDGDEYDYLGNLCHYHEETFIHMEPTTFTLSLSDSFRNFLDFAFGIEEDSW